MRFIEDLFNILAPHECLVCTREDKLLCGPCRDGLVTLPPRCYICKRWSDNYRTCQQCRRNSSLFEVRAVTEYSGAAKELIHQLKFARAKAAAKTIAEALAGKLPAEEILITHVPTAPSRIRERGYDQAALIARAVAKQTGLPNTPLLARANDWRQVGQQRQARLRHMKDAFRVRGAPLLQNKHVLIIDDVLTTGATCEAAARTLRQAGAKRVSAAVFAVA